MGEVKRVQQADTNFLDLNIALSYVIDLPLRALKVVFLFFKLYSIRLKENRIQRISPTQACKLVGVNKLQFTLALEDLTLHNVVRRIPAREVEVMVDGAIKHSTSKLEQRMECFVPGTIYDKAGYFYCLNLRWQTWLVSKNVTVEQAQKNFSIESLAHMEEEIDTDANLATRALTYFCEKFSSHYGVRYLVSNNDNKSLKFIIEKLSLAGKNRDLVFACIDHTFTKMSRTDRYRPHIRHVLEDFQSGVFDRPAPPPPSSESSEFVEGLDGGLYKRGTEAAERALQQL